MLKRYLVIFTATAALLAPLTLLAQNNDSITVIPSRQKNANDTANYAKPDGKRSTGQQQPKAQRPPNFWDRTTVGGWLSFQVGSITGIAVSPEFKIRLVNQLWGGVGLIYQYSHYKNWYQNSAGGYEDFSSNTVGGRVFFRYYLSGITDNPFIGNLFGHVEYEYLSYSQPYTQVSGTGPYRDPNGRYYVKGSERIDFNSLFVGGGYRQVIAGKAFFDFLILFDLNNSWDSPYTNPIFRFGAGVGL